jgi:DNA-binding transcriptional LysR family regulator
MELRQIKSFVVVAEELHFGRAASRLNIAQPAVTAQIQSLERELGVQLFDRSTRRVHLTEAGSVFLERSLQVLRDLDRSCAATQAAAGRSPSRITIGTTHSATFGVLPALIARIRRRNPEMRVHIHNGTTDDIVREIELGHVNFGFIRPIENVGSLRWQVIAREKYQLAVATDNPLCGKAAIRLEDLRQQRIVTFARDNRSYTERYFAEKFAEFGLVDQIACTCNDTLSMVSLVSAGIGVGFVPEWVAATLGRNIQLHTVEGVDFSINLGLAWSTRDPIAGQQDIIDLSQGLAA